eukprot:5714902-Pyramimonas_sp.AAC.1
MLWSAAPLQLRGARGCATVPVSVEARACWAHSGRPHPGAQNWVFHISVASLLHVLETSESRATKGKGEDNRASVVLLWQATGFQGM